nr:PH domain-containing protein [Nocardia thailandica]
MNAVPSEHSFSWSTPLAGLIAVAGGGVVLAVAAFLAQDGPSRLLIGVAAVVMLGLAGLGLRQRPRLSAVAGPAPKLIVGTLTGRDEYPLEVIDRIRLVSYRRIGRKTTMLEVDVHHDGAERLLIFGRWDLGTNPVDVFDLLVTSGFESVT